MNECDNCNKDCSHLNECLGEGVGFQRLRRITGYISGDYKTSFNNAKQKEVEDRLTHNTYNRTESYHN